MQQVIKDRPRQPYQYRYNLEPDRETYREHYQAHYGTASLDYPLVEQAYLLGHDLGARAENRRNSWDDVSGEARETWGETRVDDDDTMWEDVVEAVRHGYEQAREHINGLFADEDGENQKRDDSDWDNHLQNNRSFYQDHFDEAYAANDRQFDDYVPAYSLGYMIASDPNYADYDLDELEEKARARWEEDDNPGPWESVSDAVRHGMEGVRTRVRLD